MKIFFLALTFILMLTDVTKAETLPIQIVKSEGGITAWLVEDKTVPVISIEFLFKSVGARNDAPEEQGLTRLLANTLDEGAGNLNSEQFQRTLNQYSIGLSFTAGRDDFYGSFKTLTKYQEKAFELLRLSLTEPRFETDAVQRMIEANQSRILNDKTDPEWLHARLENSILYKNHPYSLNAGGTLQSLEKISPELLRQKWKNSLSQENLLIAVAGNISAETLKIELDKIFGKIPKKLSTQHKNFETINISKNPQRVFYAHEMPQTILSLTTDAVAHTAPDYFAFELTNQIFGGGGFGSRLTDVIREQKGLTYGIYSSLSQMDYMQNFSIQTSVRNENLDKTIEAIKVEINKMKENPVAIKELNDAKNYLIGSSNLNLTSTSRIADFMLSLQKLNLPLNYLELREEKLRNVTLQDIQNVSQKYFNFDKMSIVILGKKPNSLSNLQTVTSIPNIESP